MIKFNDFIVDIRQSKAQHCINIITVRHKQTGKYLWKECRSLYPNEQEDIIEMLIEILKRELEDELE